MEKKENVQAWTGNVKKGGEREGMQDRMKGVRVCMVKEGCKMEKEDEYEREEREMKGKKEGDKREERKR